MKTGKVAIRRQDGAIRVLGIDPGLALTGYALLEMEGNTCRVLDYGCIRTPVGLELPQRLLSVFQSVSALISRFRPGVMALERLFFCKNVRTATQVGEARGAILTAAAALQLPVAEYTPLQVKQAVTGYGKAEKKQIQQMVSLILRLAEPPQPDDAADALAIALCHLQSYHWQEKVAGKGLDRSAESPNLKSQGKVLTVPPKVHSINKKGSDCIAQFPAREDGGSHSPVSDSSGWRAGD